MENAECEISKLEIKGRWSKSSQKTYEKAEAQIFWMKGETLPGEATVPFSFLASLLNGVSY